MWFVERSLMPCNSTSSRPRSAPRREEAINLHQRLFIAVTGIAVFSAAAVATAALVGPALGATTPILEDPATLSYSVEEPHPDQVLEWNQIFIDTLIATNTPNSSSQRLGAIVHTAIFDAYNGIERRYTPIFVNDEAPAGASRRAAVIAAAYTALVGLFPSRKAAAGCQLRGVTRGAERRWRGRRPIARARHRLGQQVAQAVLAWRADDGFAGTYPSFTGGTAVGQWRPTPPLFRRDERPRVGVHLDVHPREQHAVPAGTTASAHQPGVHGRLQHRQGARPRTGSTRTADQTALAAFWEFNASVHWNQAANQLARANHFSMSDSNRLLAVLNIAMADTAITTWSAKRHYGALPTEVTWRPVTAIPLADTDGNPDTTSDPDWLPLIDTPAHPEYPAGHPSLNGAAATVLLSYFDDAQTFTLTATGQPSRAYMSITKARQDGNDARVWGGMHYSSTVAISDAEGEAIANYVNENSMQYYEVSNNGTTELHNARENDSADAVVHDRHPRPAREPLARRRCHTLVRRSWACARVEATPWTSVDSSNEQRKAITRLLPRSRRPSFLDSTASPN